MATIQQLVGRWRLVESKGFDEYMKEVLRPPLLGERGGLGWRSPRWSVYASSLPSSRAALTGLELAAHTLCRHCRAGRRGERVACGKIAVRSSVPGLAVRCSPGLSILRECVMNNVTSTRVYEKVE
ncbi:fatty acid-binding protein, epidermal-like protein [Camelus ferus]|nr:fatty acid-binding protein, epidermal-like protein [Camelus ferus]